MSAQYRPYRDEESVDGLETTSWTDNEPGSIQIYEKTTEELPFAANKKNQWIQVGLYILIGILGFLLGFYGPFPHQHSIQFSSDDTSDGQHSSQSSGYSGSEMFEDPTIKSKLLDQLDGHRILATLEKFQNTKRTPGSDGDHQFAAYIEGAFIEYGLEPVTALNYTFKTMLPKQSSIVRILDKDNKTIYSTNYQREKSNTSSPRPLDEAKPYLPLSQAEETLITTNQLLYLNKGLKEDYTKLVSLGLNSNETDGKIFVLRQTFYQAHDVVINAQESGALAVLFFPDPDTFGSSSPFPSSVQLPDDAARSHPLAWSNYGDLASLNISLSQNIDLAKMGLEKESKVHIPVILISYNTAKDLLIGLSGVPAPAEWNCFDFTLHLGPGYKEDREDGRSKIQLEFFNHETTLTTTTITGIIAGAAEPDRYIVMGSRRDSLSDGLLDSVSGTAVMLEIARVYGSLLKTGWRPRRTIIFNSFGAESFNLIGSSNWLEAHQRLLHSRAVSYINCDQIVTGNRSVTVSASPLLYQVLYNATKQVRDPDSLSGSIYRRWMSTDVHTKLDEVAENRFIDFDQLNKMIEGDQSIGTSSSKSSKAGKSDNSTTKANENESAQDNLGYQGNILHEYKKSATVVTRPKVRRLDLQSIYSPFFLYAGIPVVDVRYTGFSDSRSKSNLLEDTMPLIGTKYDNLAAVQLLDPHLKYHVAVGQILSEILRDLSDSIFLPFNLLDYAVTLGDSYMHFKTHFGKTFEESNLELGK